MRHRFTDRALSRILCRGMKLNRRTIGNEYERRAGAYLETQGYEILEYNVFSRSGELDIVARQGEYLVFVEVKYRKDTNKGYPLEAISFSKQKSISKCALYYMRKHHLMDMPIRFDVVGILGDEIQIVKNAFEFAY